MYVGHVLKTSSKKNGSVHTVVSCKGSTEVMEDHDFGDLLGPVIAKWQGAEFLFSK